MRGRTFLFGLSALALVSIAGVTTSTESAEASPPAPGIHWEWNETGKGFSYKPPGEGTKPGQGQPPKPDRGGWYYKTEPGVEKNEDDLYIWHCSDHIPPEQGLGDTYDKRCESATPDVSEYMSALVCPQSWAPDGRPVIPYATLRQNVKWIEGFEDWTPESEETPPPDWDGKWDYRKWACTPISEDRWLPVEEITKKAHFEVFKELGEPDLEFAPGNGKALAQYPSIVWTDYPRKLPPGVRIVDQNKDKVVIEFDVQFTKVNGQVVTGRIRATAAFLWKFEDGGTAEGRGRKYEPGRLPSQNPGYYLTNTFTKLGKKKVTLNVRWTGKVTIETLPPQDIEPVEIPVQEETLEVVESRPVLGN